MNEPKTRIKQEHNNMFVWIPRRSINLSEKLLRKLLIASETIDYEWENDESSLKMKLICAFHKLTN